MTGPDHIWATVNGASTDVITHKRGLLGGWREHLPQRPGHTEYIRRDSAVLAALPELQAMIAEALEMAEAGAFSAGYEAGERAEREACAVLIETRDGSIPYRQEIASAIRKRGED